MEILAAADTLAELCEKVEQQGIEDPIFERVPSADARFIGLNKYQLECVE